ncbi:hypothetical protein RH858_08210 [Halalkaliarchaeum sp. AArc-GB]|nr:MULTISPECIES: hypothetical protein [unclassified Halalkaliarchaeum]MDR5673131.1 hypothetical protein [Halalkaliarchaeum sp. AArc-GB]
MGHGILVSHLVEKLRGNGSDDDENSDDDSETERVEGVKGNGEDPEP